MGTGDVLESTRFDSLQLMSTCVNGSRFAKQFENFPQVATNWGCRFCRIERLVTVDFELSYQKSIGKTLRKFSSSGHERGL